MLRNQVTLTAPVELHDDARSERLFKEYRTLLNLSRNMAYSHPDVIVLGEDPVVEHLRAAAGFERTDLVIMRLLVCGRNVTAIACLTRIWRSPASKKRLLQLKADALKERCRCIIVPQRWLKSPVRCGVARTIAQARTVRFARRHAERVLNHLREVRISTIAEAAAAVTEHSDPVAVILAMASQGLVDLDRRAPLSGRTWLSARL